MRRRFAAPGLSPSSMPPPPAAAADRPAVASAADRLGLRLLDGPAAAARFGARSGGEPAAAEPAWDRDPVTLVAMAYGVCLYAHSTKLERPGPAGGRVQPHGEE